MRVGHRQASIRKAQLISWAFFCLQFSFHHPLWLLWIFKFASCFTCTKFYEITISYTSSLIFVNDCKVFEQ